MHLLTHHKNKILHVDADSFFASCERANDPRLRSKPVCVGAKKHGIVLAATYDAKRLGIKTGMPVWEAQKILPARSAHYVDCNFSLYARYSERMFDVFREVSPDVEEASVDEAFIDVGGLRRMYKTSYVGIAKILQDQVWRKLGLPVSVGVGPSKTLAKMASKRGKPWGIFEVPKRAIHTFLEEAKLDDVPGFGVNTVALLEKIGVRTPADFVQYSDMRIRNVMHKPGVVLWHELRGVPSIPFVYETPLPKSMSRTRSFGVMQNETLFRLELVNHFFLICRKLRKKKLRAKKVFVYIRDKNFRVHGVEKKDMQAHSSSIRFAQLVLPEFTQIIRGKKARSVGIVLQEFEREGSAQLSVFEEDQRVWGQEALLHTVDRINEKHGRYTVKPAYLFGDSYESEARKEQESLLSLLRLGGTQEGIGKR